MRAVRDACARTAATSTASGLCLTGLLSFVCWFVLLCPLRRALLVDRCCCWIAGRSLLLVLSRCCSTATFRLRFASPRRRRSRWSARPHAVALAALSHRARTTLPLLLRRLRLPPPPRSRRPLASAPPMVPRSRRESRCVAQPASRPLDDSELTGAANSAALAAALQGSEFHSAGERSSVIGAWHPSRCAAVAFERHSGLDSRGQWLTHCRSLAFPRNRSLSRCSELRTSTPLSTTPSST